METERITRAVAEAAADYVAARECFAAHPIEATRKRLWSTWERLTAYVDLYQQPSHKGG